MHILIDILKAFWFFLPIGVANMAPVLVRKHFQFANVPLDGGVMFFGKPLFGSHKTWRGLIAACIAGGIVFFIQQYLYINARETFEPLSLIDYSLAPWHLGFLMGFGAIIGDLVKSFFKRRLGIADGARWIPFDQLDYILGGLLFASFFVNIGIKSIIIILVLGFLLHIATNHIGYALGIRKTKW